MRFKQLVQVRAGYKGTRRFKQLVQVRLARLKEVQAVRKVKAARHTAASLSTILKEVRQVRAGSGLHSLDVKSF